MRFRSRQRLRTGAEFDAAFKRGARLDGRAVPPRGRAQRPHLRPPRPGGEPSRRRSRRAQPRQAAPARGLPTARSARAARASISSSSPKPAIVGRGQAEVDRELRERVLRDQAPGPRWPARLLLLLVEAYRVALSPLLGGHCRFWPSCSVYAEEAIRRHGARRGAALAARRAAPLSSIPRRGHRPGPVARRPARML